MHTTQHSSCNFICKPQLPKHMSTNKTLVHLQLWNLKLKRKKLRRSTGGDGSNPGSNNWGFDLLSPRRATSHHHYDHCAHSSLHQGCYNLASDFSICEAAFQYTLFQSFKRYVLTWTNGETVAMSRRLYYRSYCWKMAKAELQITTCPMFKIMVLVAEEYISNIYQYIYIFQTWQSMFKIIVAVAEEHDLDFYALYTR